MRHTMSIYYNCAEYWLAYIQSRLFYNFKIKANEAGSFSMRNYPLWFGRLLNSCEIRIINLWAGQSLTMRSEKKNCGLKKQVLPSKLENNFLSYSFQQKTKSLKQSSNKLLQLILKACANTFLRYFSEPRCHGENEILSAENEITNM